MTTTDTTPSADPMANPVDARLWVERIGHRRYTGYNDRGARVEIGNTGDEGVFGPVELLKLALAGCAGLTGDSALSRRLGEDVAVTIEVGGPTDGPQDRVPAFAERLVVDLTGLPEAVILAAECDPIAPQSRRYAHALRTAGVAVDLHVYPGMIHGFAQYPDRLEAARDAIARAGRAIRRALAEPPEQHEFTM